MSEERSVASAEFSPTNDVRSFADVALPVVTSLFVDGLAAPTLAAPPADVTAPIPSPATPSPVCAVDVCAAFVRLLPSWRFAHVPLVVSLHDPVMSAISVSTPVSRPVKDDIALSL